MAEANEVLEKLGSELRDEMKRTVEQIADEMIERDKHVFPDGDYIDHQATVMYLKGVATGINTALRLMGEAVRGE